MKYTMKDFFDGLCLIKVENEKEHYELMRECQKAGKKWMDWKPIREEDTRSYDGLFVFEDHGSGLRLCIGANRKVPNVLYKDVIKNVKNYTIIIDCDGDTTTAKMIVNGKEVKAAQAKRNPADKFNWKLAADLAFNRLFGEKKAEKPEAKVKKVRRTAKIGEYIEITNPWGSCGRYKKGDILNVKLTRSPGVIVEVCSRDVYVAGDEYVVLEGYKPSK